MLGRASAYSMPSLCCLDMSAVTDITLVLIFDLWHVANLSAFHGMTEAYVLPHEWLPTGLALGIKLAGLSWTVCGIMLAGTTSYYTDQQTDLTASFTAKYLSGICSVLTDPTYSGMGKNHSCHSCRKSTLCLAKTWSSLQAG